jgi:type II secretory pathway component PulF
MWSSVLFALGAVLVVGLLGFAFAIVLTPKKPKKAEAKVTQLELIIPSLERIEHETQHVRQIMGTR